MACLNFVSSPVRGNRPLASQSMPLICTVLSRASACQNQNMPKCCNIFADMREPRGKCKSGLHVLTETAAARRIYKTVFRAQLQKERIEASSRIAAFKKDPKAINAITPPDLQTGEISETGSSWASSIGRRKFRGLTMDDAHLSKQLEFQIGCKSHKAVLHGVFDGFGGPGVSQAIRDKIDVILINNLERFNAKGLNDRGIYDALRQTIDDIETLAKTQPRLAEVFNQSGSTATIALQLGQQVYTANVGDSRISMLTVKNGNVSIRQLTEDQKVRTDIDGGRARRLINPDNSESGYRHNGEPVAYFESRVLKAGGEYSGNRLFGGEGSSNEGIAVSRAVGAFKIGDALSSLAKIGKFRLDPDAEQRLFLQCDGMHDVATTEDYGQLAFELQSNPEFAKSGISLAEAFLKNAFALGSKDNLTSLTTLIKVSKDDIIIPSDAKGIRQAKDYIEKIKAEALSESSSLSSQ